MKRRFTESIFMLASILKWIVLPTIIGGIVGLSTTVFLKLLGYSVGATKEYPYFYLLLPLAMFCSVVLVKYFAPESEGHGTEKIIAAVHKKSGKIDVLVVPIKLVATIITIAFGGSAGKEGPSAQIGAALASVFADLFRFTPAERRKLVICGISAGFASVFGTPIAGAIFAVEVLFVGSILYDVLLPSFVAAIISQQVAAAFGISHHYYLLDAVPSFSGAFFLQLIIAGVFFGVVASLLIDVLHVGDQAGKRLQMWKPLKGLIGGGLLVVLTLIFSARYLGLGIETVEASLHGEPGRWYDFLMKMVYSSITLGFGGSGGILTPIFFIGSSAGNFFGQLLSLDLAVFSALGLVGVLAGSTNAPIAASILAVELFGPAIAPHAALVCVVSFLMTGHNSVYPSQVLAMRKSSSVDVELGKEVEVVNTRFKPTNRQLVKIVGRIWGQKHWYRK